MLDYVDKFKSDISVFTNLTINHLDHHNSFKDYVKAKLKLLKISLKIVMLSIIMMIYC